MQIVGDLELKAKIGDSHPIVLYTKTFFPFGIKALFEII